MAKMPARVSSSKPARPIRTDNQDIFKTSKKDKQRIKHSALVSRIEKANTKVPKRRRPSKRLITTLESLANALPDATADDSGDAIVDGVRIRHRSLKSRPGAMKRKEKIEHLERDRFAKNMAQMARLGAGPSVVASAEATNDKDVVPKVEAINTKKWAALRDFIASTMK